MRKLLSLLLCLTLFLPMMAMAEVTPKQYTIDFGDFTMGLYEGDYYEVAPEKINNAVYAMIYPAYDETASSHDNMNVVWREDDIAADINFYGVETFAKLYLQSLPSQFETVGIKMTDAQLLKADFEDGIGIIIYSANLDHTGTGNNLITTIYQLQVYFCNGEAGTYTFTIGASTLEDLYAMSAYLDSVKFK